MRSGLKRTIALLLILSVMICIMPAYAASAFEIEMPAEVVTIEREGREVVLITKVNNTSSGVLGMKLVDASGKYPVTLRQGDVSVSNGNRLKWSLDFDEELAVSKTNIKHLVYFFTLDGKQYDYSVYLTYDRKKDVITVEKGMWYSNNTACSFGLPLRDMKRPVTSKWYHVTPVDLTIQGEQVFPYLASNLYIIGEVSVYVTGDIVRVDYTNFYETQGGNTKTVDEFMTLYHDMSEVKDDYTKAPRTFAFGQPISIEEDLEGDTNVLLSIVNHVTYCNYVTGTHKLTRFWPNLKENIAWRAELELLMNREDFPMK